MKSEQIVGDLKMDEADKVAMEAGRVFLIEDAFRMIAIMLDVETIH